MKNCAAILMVGLAGALAVGLTGCVEEKVIYNRPMFAALPNAQVNQVVTMPRGYQNVALKPKVEVDPKDPNKKFVTATNGRQLMVNIYNALAKQDRATFNEQILSADINNSTEALGSGGAGTTFEELYERSDDVVELFNRIPMGEYTPGVYMEKVKAGVFRVKLYGPTARGLHYTGFDMSLEKSSWRLVRFLTD